MSPVAVVTGSTRGIGLGLARELRKRGCQVVITGRSGAPQVAAGGKTRAMLEEQEERFLAPPAAR